MKMLQRFDEFIYSYISESSGDEGATRKRLASFTTNEFFFRFIQPAAAAANVLATKQRENTFLVFGPLKGVKAFFAGLKVSGDYMERPSEFMVYSPQFTYGEHVHNLKRDEDYPVCRSATTAPHMHEIDNLVRDTIDGRWYPMLDGGRKVKGIRPAEVARLLRGAYPKASGGFDEGAMVYVEFQVDCDGRANQIYDKMSEYAKSPDEMNALHSSSPDDFDYTQLNAKAEDRAAKASLKGIKRTETSFGAGKA